MLIAKNQKGLLVSALENGLNREETYRCPGCQGIVLLRQGKVICPHFAHKSLQDCQFFSENESAQHLSLKATVYQSLDNHGERVCIEKVLPELGQIADLFVGDSLALEVQCSRLSQKRLRERTLAYHQIGYEVRWLLGQELWLGQRLTDLQRDFLYFTLQHLPQNRHGFPCWQRYFPVSSAVGSLLAFRLLQHLHLPPHLQHFQHRQPLQSCVPYVLPDVA